MPLPCHLMLVLSPTLILTADSIMSRVSNTGSLRFYHHREGLLLVENDYNRRAALRIYAN